LPAWRCEFRDNWRARASCGSELHHGQYVDPDGGAVGTSELAVTKYHGRFFATGAHR